VIVRGGGDITHESFNAFKSKSAAQAVSALVSLGVFVIVGVGHYDDRFLIDEKASISAITPTDAAYRLLKHVNESIINEAGPHYDKLSRE
jgi:exonuclease VII large subunit